MLHALGITGRVKETLEQIESSSSYEYARLKRRFREHQIILQSNPDLSNEQIQFAVDAILTDEDLDAQMADVLCKELPRPPSRGFRATFTRWTSGAGPERPRMSSSKRFHLPPVADSDFLAELHTSSIDQPVYKETAEKIIISAGQQVCTKLKRVLEVSLGIAKEGLRKLLQEEVRITFANRHKEESSRANAELRSRVRDALANEHVDPDNRYANPSFEPFLIRTEAENSVCVLIRGVTQERRSHPGRSNDHTQCEILADPFQRITTLTGIY